jgi:hypothetical protein
MRIHLLLVALLPCPRIAAAEEPALPSTVAEAQALLDGLAADLEAYRNDANANAAAPDAIRQAGEAIEDTRGRLVQSGVAGAEPELRRARLLLELIAELVEAREMELAADGLADKVVEALERLAVVKAAYARVTEQLHLFAIPMPGEAGR